MPATPEKELIGFSDMGSLDRSLIKVLF